MTKNCRAALWYSKDISITNSTLGGIKALRECSDVTIYNSYIDSAEFGWKTKKLTINNTDQSNDGVYGRMSCRQTAAVSIFRHAMHGAHQARPAKEYAD